MSHRLSISTNPLEYAAEVAYIVATSPPADAGGRTESGEGDDEFEFSFSERQLRHGLQTLNVNTRDTQEDREKKSDKDDKATAEFNGEIVSEQDFVKSKPMTEETDFPEMVTPRRKSNEGWSDDKMNVTPSLHDQPHGEQQKIIVVYGPTNYANRQLVSKLVQSNPSIFTLVVPHTSRKKHQNEINGVDFHFVDRKFMSGQVKKGTFMECVKISSPKMKVKKRSATVSLSQASSDSSTPTSPLSPTDVHDGLVNPWKQHKIIQVPSPPKSRQRSRTSVPKRSDLYGISKEAMYKAQMLGKPCIVLNVTYKGAEQLKKAGYDGVYIMLEVGGETGEEETDAANTSDGPQPDHRIAVKNMEQAFAELQRYTFQVVSSLSLTPRTKADVTRDEWESLPTVEMDQEHCLASSPVSTFRLLTFTDLLVRYQRECIGTKPTKTKRSIALSKGLRTEYDLVLSLSSVPLSDTDKLHIEALQTIYQKLMGSALNCRRYGPHWQDIGFQSVDPGECLKEVGFFGVMQLISFLERTLFLAMEIFTYSREALQQFPFATVSISLTEAALKSLRDGYLTKLCNKQDQVFVTLNDYHVAMFYRFYQLWKSQTASQVLPVIQSVTSFAKKQPKLVTADLQAYLQSGKDVHELAPVCRISRSLSNPFTPFHKLADEQERQAVSHTNPSTTPHQQ